VPEASVVRSVDLFTGRLGEPVRLPTDADVLGVTRGVVVCQSRSFPLEVELFRADGSRLGRVTGPERAAGLRPARPPAPPGGWPATSPPSSGLDVGTGAVRTVPVALDCRPYMA
jgi:hypothetical protein